MISSPLLWDELSTNDVTDVKETHEHFLHFWFRNEYFPLHLRDGDAFSHELWGFALDHNRNIMLHDQFLCFSGTCALSYFFEPPLEKSDQTSRLFSFNFIVQNPWRASTEAFLVFEFSSIWTWHCGHRARDELSNVLTSRHTHCSCEWQGNSFVLHNWTVSFLSSTFPDNQKPSSLPSLLGFFSKCFFLICQTSSLSITLFYTKFEILCSEKPSCWFRHKQHAHLLLFSGTDLPA